MSDIVIRAEGLGKKYIIGHQARRESYTALRDVIARGAGTFYRKANDMFHGRPVVEGDEIEEVWALRDVSFEVKRGEVIGIIGRNGAGKSTLLKVLSRITEPSSGRVHISGRVASLLEVGTGFHPELTGRENIFLNGAILGMTRSEIGRKFDEIVAFAEIEKFLDTPVKRYSSGMYVRLAFAVAAHLEPEILIVDEVLAVGDVAFQKKCIGKMRDVSQAHSRTVLFVSHNLQAVRQLCSKVILLADGSVQAEGTTQRVINEFERSAGSVEPSRLPLPPPELADICYVTAAFLESADGRHVEAIPVGQEWRVRVRFRIVRAMEAFVASVGFVTSVGTPVQTVWSKPAQFIPGEYEATFVQDCVVLAAGSYSIVVGLSENERTFQQITCGRLELTGEGAVGYFQATSGMGFVLNSMTIQVCKTS